MQTTTPPNSPPKKTRQKHNLSQNVSTHTSSPPAQSKKNPWMQAASHLMNPFTKAQAEAQAKELHALRFKRYEEIEIIRSQKETAIKKATEQAHEECKQSMPKIAELKRKALSTYQHYYQLAQEKNPLYQNNKRKPDAETIDALIELREKAKKAKYDLQQEKNSTIESLKRHFEMGKILPNTEKAIQAASAVLQHPLHNDNDSTDFDQALLAETAGGLTNVDELPSDLKSWILHGQPPHTEAPAEARSTAKTGMHFSWKRVGKSAGMSQTGFEQSFQNPQKTIPNLRSTGLSDEKKGKRRLGGF